MGKRTATTACAPAAKKEKINPVFVDIQDALGKARHLPVNCQAMLAAMVPASFAIARAERTEQQEAVIQWMEEALMQEHGKLTAETDVVVTQLSQLEASKAERMVQVRNAEAALAQKKELLPLRKQALAEATISMSSTKKLLAEKQQEQQSLDGEFLAMKKEQEGLALAFVEHFQVPLDAGEELHYHELQPFLSKLDLEESFLVSIPASCSKTKAQRGQFDDVVLQALQESLLNRATQIKDAVSNQSPESKAREAGVREVEERLAEHQAAKEKANVDLAAAQKDVENATAALKEIEQFVAGFEDELKAAAAQREKVQSFQDEFERGPLTIFKTTKEGIVANCATAGA